MDGGRRAAWSPGWRGSARSEETEPQQRRTDGRRRRRLVGCSAGRGRAAEVRLRARTRRRRRQLNPTAASREDDKPLRLQQRPRRAERSYSGWMCWPSKHRRHHGWTAASASRSPRWRPFASSSLRPRLPSRSSSAGPGSAPPCRRRLWHQIPLSSPLWLPGKGLHPRRPRTQVRARRPATPIGMKRSSVPPTACREATVERGARRRGSIGGNHLGCRLGSRRPVDSRPLTARPGGASRSESPGG